MKVFCTRFLVVPIVVLAISGGSPSQSERSAPGGSSDPQSASLLSLLHRSAPPGGLLVHVGCGDGTLTASLRLNDRWIVQGLSAEAKEVERARQTIAEKGLWGPVSVRSFQGRSLPYAENMVNVIVLQRRYELSQRELFRVLQPRGLLMTKRGSAWYSQRKPVPQDTDQWTHYLHDPSGNAVAHDSQVGPPGRLRWVAPPRHARSHEHTPTISAVVSCGGKLFYLADTAPTAWIRCPPRWHLVCRDAYNGLPLWKRSFDPWFPHLCNWGAYPLQLQRRLVAVDGKVFVTLGYFAPVSCLDGRTGKTLRVYRGTAGTDEILCHRGILLCVVREPTPERKEELAKWYRLSGEDNSPLFTRETARGLLGRLRSTENRAPRRLCAVDAASGRLLWQKKGKEAQGLRPLSVCARADRVFYQQGQVVVCCDLGTGRPVWSRKAPRLFCVSKAGVFCAGGDSIACLSARTGDLLWSQRPWLCQIRDVFVIQDSLLVGGFRPYQGRRKGKRGPAWGPYFVVERDAHTGALKRRIEPQNPGHHHRCYRNKATDRYILAGRRGVEFYDCASGEVLWHSWVRGVCRYGIMPANGLLYAPPHACGCYITAKLTGFYALAKRESNSPPAQKDLRLEKGPAYGSFSCRPTGGADWPQYRHDARRSGATPQPVGSALTVLWKRKVGAALTALTVSGGRVCVARKQSPAVVCLDARTGKVLWRQLVPSPVDSPPTFAGGGVLFGCRDGSVWCVRAGDGALAWRLHASGGERSIVAWGRLESVAPVSGSVLLWRGQLYFLSGRSSYLDGGIALWGVDPRTGQVRAKTTLWSPDPRTGRQPPQYGPASMPGALSDLLSAGNSCLYLRDMAFDENGKQATAAEAHLFTLTGFLDDSWPHRSYWIFGTTPSLSIGCAGRKRDLVYGRLIVFNEKDIYGYGRSGVHWSNQLRDGQYRLFCLDRATGKLRWTLRTPFPLRAMVLAGSTLFAAGPKEGINCEGGGPFAGKGAALWAISCEKGEVLKQYDLPSGVLFDGMAAARGKLFLSCEDGTVLCFGEASKDR